MKMTESELMDTHSGIPWAWLILGLMFLCGMIAGGTYLVLEIIDLIKMI